MHLPFFYILLLYLVLFLTIQTHSGVDLVRKKRKTYMTAIYFVCSLFLSLSSPPIFHLRSINNEKEEWICYGKVIHKLCHKIRNLLHYKFMNIYFFLLFISIIALYTFKRFFSSLSLSLLSHFNYLCNISGFCPLNLSFFFILLLSSYTYKNFKRFHTRACIEFFFFLFLYKNLSIVGFIRHECLF